MLPMTSSSKRSFQSAPVVVVVIDVLEIPKETSDLALQKLWIFIIFRSEKTQERFEGEDRKKNPSKTWTHTKKDFLINFHILQKCGRRHK